MKRRHHRADRLLTENDLEKDAVEALRWITEHQNDTVTAVMPELYRWGTYFCIGRHWITIISGQIYVTALGRAVLEEKVRNAA